MKDRARWAPMLISVLFLLILTVSGVGIFLFQRQVSEVENRVLQTFPKPNTSDVLSGKWQEDFETFTADQFPLRDGLNSLAGSIRYALGRRELGGVLIGRTADGVIRLFEAPGYDPERTERLSDTLDAIDRFAACMGDAETVFLPIPSSGMIYGEDMPPHTGADELETLYAMASAAGESYTAVSPLQAILDAKTANGESLYFRTDHHWTVRGACAAYDAYCEALGMTPADADFERLSDSFYGTLFSKAPLPSITPDTLEKSTLDVSGVHIYAGGGYGGTQNLAEIPLYHDDALSRKDKYEYFMGGNYGLAVIENDALTDGKTLLLFKDSFADCFVPFLTAHYSRIVMIDPRYYRGSSGDLRSLIETESPSDVLFLYEIATLADDTSLHPLLERVVGE